MFLAVMMALFVESCGAEMRIQGAHVYGENEIDGRWILYDFDVPKEVETVKQYKTEFVKMNLSLVKSILEKYVQKPRSMDAWDLTNSNQWNDTNFCYFEQNGRYTCEGSYYRGPRKNADTEPVRLASEKVYNLLEELNISDFEYPFYVETSQCKLIETVFEKIESEDDYIRVKGDTDSMAAEYYDKEVLGKERSIIVTRFLIDGIPLCISDTSPHKKYRLFNCSRITTFCINLCAYGCGFILAEPIRIFQVWRFLLYIFEYQHIYGNKWKLL